MKVPTIFYILIFLFMFTITALEMVNAETNDSEAVKDKTSYCCDSCPTEGEGNYCEKLEGEECQKYTCLLECPCGSTKINVYNLKCNPC